MGIKWGRGRSAAVALAAISAIALTGCGNTDSKTGTAGGKVHLVVDTFGQFGYEGLVKDYMTQHQNIEIELRGTGSNLDDYSAKLTKELAAGRGAGDVVAIEEGLMLQYKANPKNFANLFDYGGAALKDNFLPWKWEAGLSPDKGQLIGLGTDVGGMAMCYRRDLFAKAGLPTDRDEVSKLWPTWEDFISTGKRFAAKNTGASFIDGAPALFMALVLQEAGNSTGYTFYDRNNQLAVDSNPAVRNAYDGTVRIVQAGLSGKYALWGPDWVTAFKQAKFATISCPAWMTGVIQGNAGDGAAGKWDIARIPGNGGNWGGSHLAVPAQSKHKTEAADLAKFLTSKEGQIAAFKAKGTLPSNPQALDDPAVSQATNAYFNKAPIGKIFGEGAKTLQPVYMGPKNQIVQTEVQNVIHNVELAKVNAADGWNQLVANAKKADSK